MGQQILKHLIFCFMSALVARIPRCCQQAGFLGSLQNRSTFVVPRAFATVTTKEGKLAKQTTSEVQSKPIPSENQEKLVSEEKKEKPIPSENQEKLVSEEKKENQEKLVADKATIAKAGVFTRASCFVSTTTASFMSDKAGMFERTSCFVSGFAVTSVVSCFMIALKVGETFEDLNNTVREGAIRQARIEKTLASLEVARK